MLTFNRTLSIPVAGNANLLQGDLMQFIPFDASLAFWMVSAGAARTDLDITITLGQMVIGGSGQPLNANTRALAELDQLRDKICQGVAAMRDQVIVAVRNTTVGAIILTTFVEATPI